MRAKFSLSIFSPHSNSIMGSSVSFSAWKFMEFESICFLQEIKSLLPGGIESFNSTQGFVLSRVTCLGSFCGDEVVPYHDYTGYYINPYM